ncbi:uncharacterized protein TNCV_2251511 [Trichonephila clavipes]|nr:uncharacterized protein TNCV_932291 [Trichonephila clavipes]GFV02313.1 uncharacterized protein TNCV_2251511 [Trichonephila clavipes]
MAKNYASGCILSTNKLSGPYFAGTPVKCLNQEDDQLLSDRFTYHELLKDMEETKKGKNAGSDDFTAEPFFNLSKKAKLTLLLFYYIIWKTSVPSEWRKSGILPIIKPRKPTDHPSSYISISLTNACYKMMDRRITNRLNCFLKPIIKLQVFRLALSIKETQLIKQTFFHNQ